MKINERIKNKILSDEYIDIISSAHQDEPLVLDGILGEKDSDFDGIVYLLKEATRTGFEKHKEAAISNGHHNEFFQQGTNKTEIWDFAATTARTICNSDERIERIWPTLCYWTAAYYETKNFADYSSLYENSSYKNDDYSVLSKVAIVNVKKTAGASTTEDKVLEAAKAYQELIKEELQIIKPKVVVCCGTYEYAKELLFKGKSIKTPLLECGAEYFLHTDGDGHKFVVVDFVHPSCRVKKQVTYAYAKDVFQELKKRNPEGI